MFSHFKASNCQAQSIVCMLLCITIYCVFRYKNSTWRIRCPLVFVMHRFGKAAKAVEGQLRAVV